MVDWPLLLCTFCCALPIVLCCLPPAPTGVLGAIHSVKDHVRDGATTHVADVLKLVADQSGELPTLSGVRLY